MLHDSCYASQSRTLATSRPVFSAPLYFPVFTFYVPKGDLSPLRRGNCPFLLSAAQIEMHCFPYICDVPSGKKTTGNQTICRKRINWSVELSYWQKSLKSLNGKAVVGVSVTQLGEHCVGNVKDHGFDFQRTHNNMCTFNALSVALTIMYAFGWGKMQMQNLNALK